MPYTCLKFACRHREIPPGGSLLARTRRRAPPRGRRSCKGEQQGEEGVPGHLGCRGEKTLAAVAAASKEEQEEEDSGGVAK